MASSPKCFLQVIALFFACLAVVPVPASGFAGIPPLPPPTLLGSSTFPDGHREWVYGHPTSPDFDSPGSQEHLYRFRVTVPVGYRPGKTYPVITWLHGGGADYNFALISQFTVDILGTYDLNVIFVIPGDPDRNFWLGYSDALPDGFPSQGTVRRYTEQRVLATIDWALQEFQPDGRPLQADANAIFAVGISMGGGSVFFGLHSPEIFAGVITYVPAVGNFDETSLTVSSGRTAKWGLPSRNTPTDLGIGIWDYANSTRILRDFPQSRDQWIDVYNGRDDDLVLWGMGVVPDANLGLSWYEALQRFRVGHYLHWDEGGHLYFLEADPVLGPHWWDSGWSPVNDAECFLRTNRSFPAFTRFSADSHPGTGTGTRGAWNVPGDNAFDGDQHGNWNRWLRWRTLDIVDREDRYAIDLRILDGAGKDDFPGMEGTVNVTPRRRQRFHPAPGEVLLWTTNIGQHGSITVESDGTFTCEQVRLITAWTTLTVSRSTVPTPTDPPGETPTSTPSSLPTETPTPLPPPPVLLAGYWTTALKGGEAATLQVLALGSRDTGPFEIAAGGIPSGIFLKDDGSQGDGAEGDDLWGWQVNLTLPRGTEGAYFLDLLDGGTAAWPYLTVFNRR